MRRGRWVVYSVALILLFFVVHSTHAATVNISATVPVSAEWKRALQLYSEAKIDTSHAHVMYVTSYSLGVEKLPVENQTIQFLVFQNGKLVDKQEKLTNKSGFADFVFVSENYGPYMMVLVNKSDTSPFIIKSASISI
jgi:hypothetical protein